MSLEAIRVDLVTAVEAARAGFNLGYSLIIEYENRIIVDKKSQVNPYLTVDILMLDGRQIELSNNPLHRITGQLYLIACVPDGSGSSQANKLLDWFVPKLHKKTFGAVRTSFAIPAKPQPHLGWQHYGIVIPFWSDQSSS